MLKQKIIALVSVLLISVASCVENSDPKTAEVGKMDTSTDSHHNARNSLDNLGMYESVLSCAHC